MYRSQRFNLNEVCALFSQRNVTHKRLHDLKDADLITKTENNRYLMRNFVIAARYVN